MLEHLRYFLDCILLCVTVQHSALVTGLLVDLNSRDRAFLDDMNDESNLRFPFCHS